MLLYKGKVMIIFKHKGDFKNTEKLFSLSLRNKVRGILETYGQKGVSALASATPKDSGLTANSWDYYISVTTKGYIINWTNSNTSDDVPVAILIQYGHSANGAFVQGRDFINPAIRPILDSIGNDIWKEVSKI
jgi:hypothetical protein